MQDSTDKIEIAGHSVRRVTSFAQGLHYELYPSRTQMLDVIKSLTANLADGRLGFDLHLTGIFGDAVMISLWPR